MIRFERALAYTLAEEGGYGNDPFDSGGPTNYGITQGDLERWRGHECSAADVQAMSRDEAAAIYHTVYWNGLRCGELRPGLDRLVFDCAVNPGQGWVARVLQSKLGVGVDGILGPLTMRAAAAANLASLIIAISGARARYYESRPTFGRFGDGWLARTKRCRLAALADIEEVPPP